MTAAPSLARNHAVLPPSFAFIALCPIVVFCLAEVVLATLAHNANPIPEALVEGLAFAEAGEAGARLHLLGLALLVLLGAACMVLKTVYDAISIFSGASRTTLVIAFVLALAVGVAFLYLMMTLEFMKPNTRLGEALFTRLFDGVDGSGEQGLWDRNTYKWLARATHWAVVLAIAAMITGSISCLAKFPDLDEKENWRLQSQRLKTYATISAAFLIVSVFYFESWATYPAFILDTKATEPLHTQFVALANAYTAFTGIEYSLVLAAYALPVSYFQSREANRIARNLVTRGGGPGTVSPAAPLAVQVQSVRHEMGLETKTQDLFKLVLAILSPLITGTLTSLTAAAV